jgi:hypothetical protein
MLAATLLVGYPILEVALSTLRRGVKRLFFNRSMEWSEKEHIHHRLLQLGLPAQAVCLTACSAQAFFSIAGLLVFFHQNALATWLIMPVFLVLACLMPRLGFFKFIDKSSLGRRPHFIIASHFLSLQRVKLGLVHTRVEILALVHQTCREFGVMRCRLMISPDETSQGGLDYFQEWDACRPVDYLNFLYVGKRNTTEGFSDSFRLCNSRGGAYWIFEPHAEEEDLDVEYRVLMREFMREALESSVKLGCGEETLEVERMCELPHSTLSGHSLRCRVIGSVFHKDLSIPKDAVVDSLKKPFGHSSN